MAGYDNRLAAIDTRLASANVDDWCQHRHDARLCSSSCSCTEGVMKDAGELARAEQDARWLAGEPRRRARAAKVRPLHILAGIRHTRFLHPGFAVVTAPSWRRSGQSHCCC